ASPASREVEPRPQGAGERAEHHGALLWHGGARQEEQLRERVTGARRGVLKELGLLGVGGADLSRQAETGRQGLLLLLARRPRRGEHPLQFGLLRRGEIRSVELLPRR